MSWYGFFKLVARGITRAVSRLRVEGLENVPDTGPFFLIPNHQSALDPVFVQSPIRRNDVHSMTKSTQFASPVFRWLIPRLNGFPTRRYRVDPQTVRTAVRLIGAGKGVVIYAEGERSWDGTLQPLRRGTVRLLLKMGVPVIPCGVDGSFDVWPRWSRGIRRRDVTIRFGAPIRWDPLEDRALREAAVPEALRVLTEALQELGARSPEEAAEGPRADEWTGPGEDDREGARPRRRGAAPGGLAVDG